MFMINFHILGAGGAVPTPTHCPSAYWVGLDGQFILLDPGPGALVRLVKSGLAPSGVDEINLVLLTHLHPDHSTDLISLLFAVHSPVCTSTAPLHIRGPVGLISFLEKLREIYGRWLTPRNRTLEVSEWSDGEVLHLPSGSKVETFRVNHPQDSFSDHPLGYRFTDSAGKIAVFSGDTAPCPELNQAARRADLLVVECSTPDNLAIDGHMHPSAVGALCAEAQPGQVVLTHQYPAAAALDLEKEVAQYFDGKISQACDGSSYQVG
jgi:ribonuclease BN (tRNA processing enzyme)